MIYLDNAATTKPNQAVLDSFLKVSEKAYYNANSPHQMGLQSEKILLQAKSRVKEMLNLNNNTDVIFTSGATESNNIALKGIALRKTVCKCNYYLSIRASISIRSDALFRNTRIYIEICECDSKWSNRY